MTRIFGTAVLLLATVGCVTSGSIDLDADVTTDGTTNSDGISDELDDDIDDDDDNDSTDGPTDGPDDDPVDDEPTDTVSPWQGAHTGEVALEVETDWNTFEFCYGEVTLIVDPGGNVTGDGECWTGWGGSGGGTSQAVALAFTGTVAHSGLTTGHVEQTLPYSGATSTYNSEGEFWNDGFELVWEGQITMGGGPSGGVSREFEGWAWID